MCVLLLQPRLLVRGRTREWMDAEQNVHCLVAVFFFPFLTTTAFIRHKTEMRKVKWPKQEKMYDAGIGNKWLSMIVSEGASKDQGKESSRRKRHQSISRLVLYILRSRTLRYRSPLPRQQCRLPLCSLNAAISKAQHIWDKHVPAKQAYR